MANAKKIILGSSLVLAGICSANANTLFQTTELGNTATIQADLLEISVHNANALRVSELCCGYGKVTLEDLREREKALTSAQAKLEAAKAQLEAAKAEVVSAEFKLEDDKSRRREMLEREDQMVAFRVTMEKEKQKRKGLATSKAREKNN